MAFQRVNGVLLTVIGFIVLVPNLVLEYDDARAALGIAFLAFGRASFAHDRIDRAGL